MLGIDRVLVRVASLLSHLYLLLLLECDLMREHASLHSRVSTAFIAEPTLFAPRVEGFHCGSGCLTFMG
jgi:hypothetical protein